MPTFAYTARSSAGKTRKGSRLGANEGALALELAAEGLFLVRAEPVVPAAQDPGRLRLKPKELATFLLHLSTYLEAGIPLLLAFQDYRDPEHPRLEAAVLDMGARLYQGAALSGIMEAYPNLFLPVHVAMVRAGETTGRLEQALRSVIRLVEWNAGLRAQVRKAATYPLILAAVLTLIILLVCAFSLPPILTLLEDLGIPLPLVTRIFLAVGHGLARHGWLLATLPAAAFFVLRQALRRPAFRLRWDAALLALPVAGGLILRMALSRFAHVFAAQCRAGIPIIQALANSEGVTGNTRLGLAIRGIRQGVEQGGRLAACAAREGHFPQLVLRMLAIGEETGKLEETLERSAGYFDAEVAQKVDLCFQVLDPVIKILMACLLVFVAIAVLLPLYLLIGGING
ncbi:MAG: type II secretion system F family protein [Holophaga sp.]|nr:type II secretion system F family protein [Holophaga sp.]